MESHVFECKIRAIWLYKQLKKSELIKRAKKLNIEFQYLVKLDNDVFAIITFNKRKRKWIKLIFYDKKKKKKLFWVYMYGALLHFERILKVYLEQMFKPNGNRTYI